MASRNNLEEINFQPYVDAVKSGKIYWNIFVKTMEDLSYSDFYRLKCLNAVLPTELTISCSDIDKLKYLNILLLNELKNFIQRQQNLFENEHVVSEDSELNDEIISKEISNNCNIQTLITGENDIKKEILSNYENELSVLEDSNVNDEIILQETSTDIDIQTSITEEDEKNQFGR